MADITRPVPLAVSRGPVEHERREQIVEAARTHFRADGYRKTSVADLAKVIGVSTAYVYRFFDSKQSIGEAVCAMTLATIAQRLFDLEAGPLTPTEKLEKFYRLLLESGYELLIEQRRMHDLVSDAVSQDWASVRNHRLAIRTVLQRIVVAGRELGEFENTVPLEQVVAALGMAAVPFAHPTLLEQRELEHLRVSATAVTGMALRSLRT